VKKRSALVLVICLTCGWPVAGCAARQPARVSASVTAADSRALLRLDLERIFADTNFAAAQWGVEIVSLDRGEILYEINPGRLYMPASNNKVLTAVSALLRLGPEFRYQTRVATDGEIGDGLLRGNLVIVGSGDPSNAARFLEKDPFRMFKDWASRLAQMGVRAIEGNIIGDDGAFEETILGSGWEWDDLAYGYAAPVSALQFNENLATIEIYPAAVVGENATVKQFPVEDYVAIDAEIATGEAGSDSRIDVERGEGRESLVLRGTVPLRKEAFRQTVAVRAPSEYYLRALRQTLAAQGIDVSHAPVKTTRAADNKSLNVLWSHSSPTLAEILKPLLKVSQNLYAETLARTLGLVERGEGSFAKGREVVEEVLRGMAIESGTYAYADGSGLSRHNLVSADLMVRILRYMYRHRFFPQFYESLPIAGVDGTISGRMRGTRAENNVHAKTGSIAYVRALSGYVRTADGEMLAFSMIANNFLVSSRAAEYVQDAALERLANFSREKR